MPTDGIAGRGSGGARKPGLRDPRLVREGQWLGAGIEDDMLNTSLAKIGGARAELQRARANRGDQSECAMRQRHHHTIMVVPTKARCFTRRKAPFRHSHVRRLPPNDRLRMCHAWFRRLSNADPQERRPDQR